jgi:translation initiation factor IF-2
VLEAKLDRGRGPVATVLVQNGTLHNSDNFVVGNVFGKVRAMFNDRGVALESAGPATPSRFSAWRDCRRLAINSSPWPIARRRAASPNIARPKPAKPRWPRVRASRSKAWPSS